MALIAVHTRVRGLDRTVGEALRERHCVATTPSWGATLRMVRERPVSALLVDVDAFATRSCEGALAEFRSLFPHVGLVALARRSDDPIRLFRLGRAGISQLVLLPVDVLHSELPRALARARCEGTPAVVLRALSPYLPRRELTAVGAALEEVHRCWDAETFAHRVGLSRPFLSECLKHWSLPSVGHLLIWVRLLHAGRWLTEPGRTGESVARQLEYNDGAAFRRALRNYTGATPTRVVERGGLSFVLDRFMDHCGFREPDTGTRVSVA